LAKQWASHNARTNIGWWWRGWTPNVDILGSPVRRTIHGLRIAEVFDTDDEFCLWAL